MSDLGAIFKAYDIRGRIDNGDLTEDVARRIGAAFAVFADADRIAVGWDCRASSPGLAAAFGAGVIGQGVDVLELGQATTPMVYFVAGAVDCPAAMITASHNPPEYNGIKLCRAGAAPIGEATGLRDVERLAAHPPPPAATPGSITEHQALGPYLEHLFGIVDASAIGAMRVAVDGGNGMAGLVLPDVFSRLEAELLGLYLEPNGAFPNHPANPLDPENLEDLLALMDRDKPDLGVAFDGDADRAFFIDELGRPLSGSVTTALIARWFLAREPGASIVYNLISSRAVPEIITQQGGKPIRTRVGHSFIKGVMADTDAAFGGEHSGHYYFRDNYRADSGVLAMLIVMQLMAESGKPLSVLRAEVDPYFSSGELNSRVPDPSRAIAAVAAAFEDGRQDFLDGLTVSWPDRWFNVRASNTEPLLRVNVEAETEEAMLRLKAEIFDVIAGAD